MDKGLRPIASYEYHMNNRARPNPLSVETQDGLILQPPTSLPRADTVISARRIKAQRARRERERANGIGAKISLNSASFAPISVKNDPVGTSSASPSTMHSNNRSNVRDDHFKDVGDIQNLHVGSMDSSLRHLVARSNADDASMRRASGQRARRERERAAIVAQGTEASNAPSNRALAERARRERKRKNMDVDNREASTKGRIGKDGELKKLLEEIVRNQEDIMKEQRHARRREKHLLRFTLPMDAPPCDSDTPGSPKSPREHASPGDFIPSGVDVGFPYLPPDLTLS